jgi:hypothetical protein
VFQVAGDNRELTSIEMAKHLAGWWPQGDTTFESDMFCLAASAGEGDAATGWPDVLGAGPFCASISEAANDPGPPERLLPPANGSQNGNYTADNSPSHGFVPIFVTQTGANSLDSSVGDFLGSTFPENPTGGNKWCDQNEADSCDDPGFGITFGGPAVITDNVFKDIATLASGNKYTDFGDLAPAVDNPFFTMLDLSAVYDNSSATNQVCANRTANHDVEFFTVYDENFPDELLTQDSEQDVVPNYDDNGVSEPTCITFTGDSPEDMSTFFGDSLSGHYSTPWLVDYSEENSVNMSGSLASASQISSSGADSHLDNNTVEGQSTSEAFNLTGAGTTDVLGTTCTNSATGSTVSMVITRNADATDTPDTFTGSFSLATSCGTYTGTVTGEAFFTGGDWHLRGMSTVTGGTGSPAATGAVGGFTLNLLTSGNSNNADDTVDNFQFDGIMP